MRSLVGGSGSVSLCGSRLVDSVGFLMVSLIFLATCILPLPLPQDFFPKFFLMFGCGSLHLLP